MALPVNKRQVLTRYQTSGPLTISCVGHPGTAKIAQGDASKLLCQLAAIMWVLSQESPGLCRYIFTMICNMRVSKIVAVVVVVVAAIAAVVVAVVVAAVVVVVIVVVVIVVVVVVSSSSSSSSSS